MHFLCRQIVYDNAKQNTPIDKREMTKREVIREAIKLVLIGAVLVFAYIPASAQRTISGQSTLTLSAYYTGTSVGAEAFYQQYTLGGFWESGIFTTPNLHLLSSGDRLLNLYIAGSGGYQWRLAATRSRNVNWYAGAGAFMGIEWLDPMRELPSYIDLGVADIRFLYGVYAKTLLELFPAPRFAIVLQGAIPVNFSAITGNIHWQAGLGFKFMLD